MWWRESGEVESVYITLKFRHFAIYVPKIIKIGWNLTKFWKKNKLHSFFETRCSFTYQALWQYSDRDPLTGAKIAIFDPYLALGPMTARASSKVITLSGGVCVSRRRKEVTASVNLVYHTKPGHRFCRGMPSASAAYAVMWCLSFCLPEEHHRTGPRSWIDSVL